MYRHYSLIWSFLSGLRCFWLFRLNSHTTTIHRDMDVLRNHTNHHCLTSTCWPAGYHGNKPSSFQSYRHWSPPCGLVIAAFQHTEYTLFVTHVCSHSHSLSSVPTKLQSVDGSAEKPKSTFTVTLQESLMDYYNTALDLWRKSGQS